MSSAELSLRPAAPEDLADVADLYLRARGAASSLMPPPAHPPAEVREWVGSWDLARREVWVAERESLVGYLSLEDHWIDSLYVDPAAWRTGVGSALVGVAVALRPRGVCLWVFETNLTARAFYAAHGFVELERTDGRANEEGSPDLRLARPGTDPLAFWRALIDEVDDDLADLLARRAALTAAVRAHRGSGPRDPAREREVAERIATRVPALGPERVARIVEVVITESLGAAADRSERSGPPAPPSPPQG